MKVCPTPGCPHLIGPGSPCPDGHGAKKIRDASRRRRAEGRGADHYSTSRWMTRRATFLRANPACVDCVAPASDADHVPPRRILLAAGVNDPDVPTYLQPRCHPCHSRRTQLVDVPLLRRLDAGDDPALLANEALAS